MLDPQYRPNSHFCKILSPARGLKPYVISNFPEIGKFPPTIGFFNFCVSRGFSSDVPLPRLVMDPAPMILSRKLPLKSQIAPGEDTCQRSELLNFRPRVAIALVVIILRWGGPAKGLKPYDNSSPSIVILFNGFARMAE